MVLARPFASACLILTLCAGPLGAARSQPAGIPGFLDPQTGRFTARPIAEVDRADTTYTGTIKLVFAITIKSTIPTSDTIKCFAGITATDSTFTRDYLESASVSATRTGNAASCTVSVPYQWVLGASPTFNAGYTISAASLRSSGLALTSGAPVGAVGSTTTVNYNVTL
jgi:hypothetical protein